jgi:hypothetical protein
LPESHQGSDNTYFCGFENEMRWGMLFEFLGQFQQKLTLGRLDLTSLGFGRNSRSSICGMTQPGRAPGEHTRSNLQNMQLITLSPKTP